MSAQSSGSAPHAAEAIGAAIGRGGSRSLALLSDDGLFYASVVRLSARLKDSGTVVKGLIESGLIFFGASGCASEKKRQDNEITHSAPPLADADDSITDRLLSLGMPDARGEKRTKPITVHVGPSLAKAIEQLSAHERRTISDYVAQVVERDPVVRTVLRQIEGPTGN